MLIHFSFIGNYVLKDIKVGKQMQKKHAGNIFEIVYYLIVELETIIYELLLCLLVLVINSSTER